MNYNSYAAQFGSLTGIIPAPAVSSVQALAKPKQKKRTPQEERERIERLAQQLGSREAVFEYACRNIPSDWIKAHSFPLYSATKLLLDLLTTPIDTAISIRSPYKREVASLKKLRASYTQFEQYTIDEDYNQKLDELAVNIEDACQLADKRLRVLTNIKFKDTNLNEGERNLYYGVISCMAIAEAIMKFSKEMDDYARPKWDASVTSYSDHTFLHTQVQRALPLLWLMLPADISELTRKERNTAKADYYEAMVVMRNTIYEIIEEYRSKEKLKQAKKQAKQNAKTKPKAS